MEATWLGLPNQLQLTERLYFLRPLCCYPFLYYPELRTSSYLYSSTPARLHSEAKHSTPKERNSRSAPSLEDKTAPAPPLLPRARYDTTGLHTAQLKYPRSTPLPTSRACCTRRSRRSPLRTSRSPPPIPPSRTHNHAKSSKHKYPLTTCLRGGGGCSTS